MISDTTLTAPHGACDCHMHIFDARFPLAANARRREPEAPVSEYRKVQKKLGLARVVVVQPTAYGRDNRCTLQAIADLGDGNCHGNCLSRWQSGWPALAGTCSSRWTGAISHRVRRC